MPPLSPSLATYARSEGAAAARAVLAGRLPTPCPWSATDRSLTTSRLAHEWAVGYEQVIPSPEPLPVD